MPKHEVVFKFKSLFDPHEVLSQWIIKLSIARNDFLYVHNRLFELNDQSGKNGESLYYFRLAVSHYREAIKFIDKFKDHKEIIDFVNTLDAEAKEDYPEFRKSVVTVN